MHQAQTLDPLQTTHSQFSKSSIFSLSSIIQIRTNIHYIISKHTISCPYTLYHATLSCQKKHGKTLYHFKIHYIMSKHTRLCHTFIMSIYNILCSTIMQKKSKRLSYQNTLYHVNIHYIMQNTHQKTQQNTIMSKYTILF